MKKQLLLFTACCLSVSLSFAQLLYDNGPFITHPGQGSGGADVSAVNSSLQTVWGFRHSMANGFRVSDDFTIPDANGWSIDSVVFFGYQTGSGNTSTFTDYRLQVWNNAPDNITSAVVYGDTVTNVLSNSYWSGIYRTDPVAFTNVDRPLMRNVINTPGLLLPIGTYWLDWGAFGSSTSGPWVPPISYADPASSVTGDAIQFSGVTQVWQAITDTNLNSQLPDAQGLPFYIYGSVIAGIADQHVTQEVSATIFPNPIEQSAMVSITDEQNGSTYSFLIMDALGREVLRMESLKTKVFEFNRTQIKNGLYSYHIYKEGVHIANGKLVFE